MSRFSVAFFCFAHIPRWRSGTRQKAVIQNATLSVQALPRKNNAARSGRRCGKDQKLKFSRWITPRRIEGWDFFSTSGLSAVSPSSRVYFTSPMTAVLSVRL